MGLVRAVEGLWNILRAMRVTIRYFLRHPITVRYPDEPLPVYPRFRGRHVLRRYTEGPFIGLEKCVGCGLCAAYCPAGCIYVEAGENDPEHPVSPGERHAHFYQINLSRCIFCGYCADACPTGAITMGHSFELADWTRDSLLYDKERLLEQPYAHIVLKSEEKRS